MNRLLVPVTGLTALALLSACGSTTHTATPTAVSPGAPTTSSVPASTGPASTAPASTAPASTSPTTTPTSGSSVIENPQTGQIVPTSTTVPPTTTPASTSTTTGAGGACQNGQIEVTALSYGGAAGQVNQVLGFVNTSNTTCTLAGYPGVAGLDPAGAQVLQAQRDTTQQWQGGEPTVTLAPGQTASAAVSGLDNPQGTATSCPYYPSLLVTPPNLTQSVTVTITGEGNIAGFPGCDGLSIAPVVAGTTGGLN